MLYFISALLS